MLTRGTKRSVEVECSTDQGQMNKGLRKNPQRPPAMTGAANRPGLVLLSGHYSITAYYVNPESAFRPRWYHDAINASFNFILWEHCPSGPAKYCFLALLT